MTEELITLTKIDTGYDVIFYNGVNIGTFEMLEDGYYHYWPTQRGGCWASYAMRAIADKLDELNKPWNDQIMNDPVFNRGVE